MLFWFVGTALVAVWLVFHDPRFDYRCLVAGALLPDLVDGPLGGARVMHSVAGSVGLLMVVMFSTVGKRLRRKRWLALPIGTFLHLVFDGAFNNTKVFWWPFSGLGFHNAPLPSLDRSPGLVVVMELAGLAMCWWAMRQFGLHDAEARRRLWRTGVLEPC